MDFDVRYLTGDTRDVACIRVEARVAPAPLPTTPPLR